MGTRMGGTWRGSPVTAPVVAELQWICIPASSPQRGWTQGAPGKGWECSGIRVIKFNQGGHGIMEPIRLENTFKINKSNLYPMIANGWSNMCSCLIARELLLSLLGRRRWR